MPHNELVKRIRKQIAVPLDMSDETLLQITKGTLLRQSIELQMSVERFSKEVRHSFEELNKSLINSKKAASKFGTSFKHLQKWRGPKKIARCGRRITTPGRSHYITTL